MGAFVQRQAGIYKKDVEQLHHEQYQLSTQLHFRKIYIHYIVAVLEEHGSLFLEKDQDLAISYSCYKIYVTGFGNTYHNVTNDIQNILI